MKKERTEELFVKWMDGCLDKEESTQLDALFEAEPDLRAELESMQGLGEMVSKSVDSSVEPPYPDFFNSQLMRKVDLEIESELPAKKAARWWESLRWAWAPAAALALVLSFFAGHRVGKPASDTLVGTPADVSPSADSTSVYFAEESLSASVIADSDGDVSVIVVEGLTAIGDDVDFSNTGRTAELPVSYLHSEGLRFH